MSKSILVLEQNPEIQGLIASSLNPEQIEIHQELNPNSFLSSARKLKPDLIFVGNSGQDECYATCRGIREDSALHNTPLVMLAQASDKLDKQQLNELGIEDRILKPFDASAFEEHLRKHLYLRHPFRDEESEPFELEKTEVFDRELTGLMNEVHTLQPSFFEEKAETSSDANLECSQNVRRYKKDKIMGKLKKSISNENQDEALEIIDATDMDSLVLDDDIGEFAKPLEPLTEKELEVEVEDSSKDRAIEEAKVNMEKSDESDLSKAHGLEDSLAINHLNEREEEELDFEMATSIQGGFEDFSTDMPSFEADLDPDDFSNDEETHQTLQEGQVPINLKINDFEDPEELWRNPPDLNQIPRDNLADILLQENDFEPELPKNLKPLGEPVLQKLTENFSAVVAEKALQMQEMDDLVIESSIHEEYREIPNGMDQIILTEQGVMEADQESVSMENDELMSYSSQDLVNEEEEELMTVLDENTEESLDIDNQEQTETSIEQDRDIKLVDLEKYRLPNDEKVAAAMMNQNSEDPSLALINEEGEELVFQQEEVEEETLEIIKETKEEVVASMEGDSEDTVSREMALEELDSLNDDMAALEVSLETIPEEDALESTFSEEREKVEESINENWDEEEDELREFMLDELDGYLEDDEAKEELEKELQDEEEKDIEEHKMSLDASASHSGEEINLEVEQFEDWDKSEDAFMKFDRFSDEETSAGAPAAESQLKEEEPIAEPVAVSQILEEPISDDLIDSEIELDDIESPAVLVEDTFEIPHEVSAEVDTLKQDSLDTELNSEDLESVVAQSVEKAVQTIMPLLVEQVMDQIKSAQHQRAN